MYHQLSKFISLILYEKTLRINIYYRIILTNKRTMGGEMVWKGMHMR